MQSIGLCFLAFSCSYSHPENLIAKEAASSLTAYPITVSYNYATDSGLELELLYQWELASQTVQGKHIITRGDEEGIGDVDGAIQTLERVLGHAEIVELTTPEAMWNYLAASDDPIASVHSFGHGFDYGITRKEDIGITVEDVLAISPAQKTAIHAKFADGAYWKFYTCHAAADNGYTQGQNIARTIAETLGIPTIAANSWVFIETTDTGVFMYPASRSRHKQEFEMHHGSGKFLGVAVVDNLYTQREAAWVTYTPSSL